jgi:hypothetical protein
MFDSCFRVALAISNLRENSTELEPDVSFVKDRNEYMSVAKIHISNNHLRCRNTEYIHRDPTMMFREESQCNDSIVH